jgi:hypothetical protein
MGLGYGGQTNQMESIADRDYSKSSRLLIWPNFYIVGAPKCGTSSVWAYLRGHPDVFFPQLKEPHFFTTSTQSLETYQALYREAKGYKAVGDASTSYLWRVNASARIREICPQARILILLRDPVERAYSHYDMAVRTGKESLPLAEAVKRDDSEIVAPGMYYEHVLRYFQTFGREQVAVHLMEDLRKDTAGVMAAICCHIGVDPALLDARELARVHNEGLLPRAGWLYKAVRRAIGLQMRQKIFSPALRSWLRNSPLLYRRYTPPRDERMTRHLQSIFEPDLCRLEDLLGRKLPELRRIWV